jgi:hypothetical protein
MSEPGVETDEQKFFISETYGEHDGQSYHRHQKKIVGPDGGGLTEQEGVYSALIAGGQPLNVCNESDSYAKKAGQNHAEGCVLLELGCACDGSDCGCTQKAGHGGTDKYGPWILGYVPQESDGDAGKDGMRDGITDERHASDDEEAAEDTAGNAEEKSACDGMPDRRILSADEAGGLILPPIFCEIPDAIRLNGQSGHECTDEKQEAKGRP